jgi:hypothetical protein
MKWDQRGRRQRSWSCYTALTEENPSIQIKRQHNQTIKMFIKNIEIQSQVLENKSEAQRENFAKVKNTETSTETEIKFIAAVEWKCPTGRRGETQIEDAKYRGGNEGQQKHKDQRSK